MPTSQFNETTEEGVVFIPHPPSLMREPPIESYKNKHLDDLSPAAEIRQLLRKTDTGKTGTGGEDGHSYFTKEEAAEWLALLAVHEKGRLHSAALPFLPCTQSVVHDVDSRKWFGPEDTSAYTFRGTPKLLLPMLKQMMRFPRPLITWNIFEEPPPASWPNPKQTQPSARFDFSAHSEPSKRQRRDPAEANSVEHDLYNSAERVRTDKELMNQRWAEDQPGHVTALRNGSFYMVKLEEGTKEEPWMPMGLVQIRHDPANDQQLFYWYARSSRLTSLVWPSTVTFKPWPGSGVDQASDEADVQAAVCEVTTD